MKAPNRNGTSSRWSIASRKVCGLCHTGQCALAIVNRHDVVCAGVYRATDDQAVMCNGEAQRCHSSYCAACVLWSDRMPSQNGSASHRRKPMLVRAESLQHGILFLTREGAILISRPTPLRIVIEGHHVVSKGTLLPKAVHSAPIASSGKESPCASSEARSHSPA